MARPRVSRKANGVKVKRPIREKVYVHIQQKIASRELPAGSPISDLAIAAELHVSRTPVRDALHKLVIEGFLEQTADGSVCVARLSRQDIIDLFDLREALEVHAVRKVAMRGLADADMERLRDLSDSIRQWGRELGQKGASLTSDQTRRFKVQDMAFHTILFQAAENLRALKTLNDVRRLIEVFTQRHAGLGIADLERAHGQHAEILAAIAAKDPDRAAKALTVHNQESQASRLEEFARWEREAALRASIPAFFESEFSSANSEPSLNELDPLDIDASFLTSG